MDEKVEKSLLFKELKFRYKKRETRKSLFSYLKMEITAPLISIT